MAEIDFSTNAQMPCPIELYLILAKLYLGMWKVEKLESTLNYLLDIFIGPLINEGGWKDPEKRSIVCHFCEQMLISSQHFPSTLTKTKRLLESIFLHHY